MPVDLFLAQAAAGADKFVNTTLSGLALGAIYGLLARDFAPIEQRLVSATARLEQMPRFLEQARGSLEPARVPKIHAETAIQQNRGLLTIIDSMLLPLMEDASPETRARLETAIEAARAAIGQHQTWLESNGWKFRSPSCR